MSRRIRLRLILSLLLLTGLASPVFSCDYCFYNCLDWFKQWEKLEPIRRELAISAWYGIYSTTRNDNPQLTKDRYDPVFRGTSGDRRIQEFIRLYNFYKNYVPNGFEVTRDEIRTPLLAWDNCLWIPVYVKTTETRGRPDIKPIYRRPERILAISGFPPRQAELELFVWKAHYYGGAVEYGPGPDLTCLPERLWSARIDLTTGPVLRLPIKRLGDAFLDRLRQLGPIGPAEFWFTLKVKFSGRGSGPTGAFLTIYSV